MITKVIKIIEDFLKGNIPKDVFIKKLHSTIDKKHEKLYKEDEEVADLITNELIEICDKNIRNSEEFMEEISAIFEEIKIIIEL